MTVCSKMKLCGRSKEQCVDCYNKSFASHANAIYWSDKNQFKPEQVFMSSDSKFWFNCKCGHDFNTSLSSVVAGRWCPYCANQKLCGKSKEECLECYNKSFAFDPRSKYWSSKNLSKPEEVFGSSGIKYFLVCENGHEFDTAPRRIKEGKWCRFCVNKTETKVNEYLKTLGLDFTKEATFNWCLSNKNKPRRFDFYLSKYRLVIELDGDQHFKQVSNWKSHIKTTYVDVYKAKLALANGISVLRIYQMDILLDTVNWRENILKNLYIRESPGIKYLSSKNLYTEHIKSIQEMNLSELTNIIEELESYSSIQVTETIPIQVTETISIQVTETIPIQVTETPKTLITKEKIPSKNRSPRKYTKNSLSKMNIYQLKEIAVSKEIPDISSYKERTKKGKGALIDIIIATL